MNSSSDLAIIARTLIVACLFALLGGCATGSRPRPGAEAPAPAAYASLLAAADRALSAGELEKAQSAYEALLRATPQSSEVALRLGDVQLRRGAAESALATFAKIADPALQPGSLQGRGLALTALGRWEEAITMLTQAAAQDSSLWRSWSALGQIYDQRQEWQAAETAYRQALAVQPDSVEVYNNLGVSMMLQHRYEEARAHFLAALERDPTASNAQANLRVSYAWTGEYQKALAHASRHEQAQVLNNVGYVAMERGDFTAAETLLTEALRASPTFYKRASDNLAELRRRALRAASVQ